MNATAPHHRALPRLTSTIALCSLAVAGIAVPSAAAAAESSVLVTVDDFGHLVDIYDGPAQTVSRSTPTIAVSLPESVAGDEFDTLEWFTDEASGSFTISGSTATVTLSRNFWSTHAQGTSFDLGLYATDDDRTPDEGGDTLWANFTVTVGAAGGAAALASEGSTIESYSYFQPTTTPLPVATGDTVSFEADPGFWTTGPDGTAALTGLDTAEDAIEISDDGSTATLTVGPPSRYREAVSPTGFAELSAVAYSDPDVADRFDVVYVSIPMQHSKPTPEIDRVAGKDRYAGAAATAAAAYPDGTDVVYIASGETFPDALSAAPAAAKEGGPLLLTKSNRLPLSVEEEIVRLQPSRIVVVGGPAAVNPAVVSRLEGLASQVDRIDGVNRFEVSRNVAEYAFGEDGSEVAFVATGTAFPDALSASAAAGSFGAPVILVRGTSKHLDEKSAALIDSLGVTYPVIAGGPAAVSDGIEADLDSYSFLGDAERLAGNGRYTTSLAIARFAFDQTDRIFIASGENFPDALAGAAWAGAVGAPLYIVRPGCVPDGMVKDIDRYAESDITVLGGTQALSPAIESLTSCGTGDLPESGWTGFSDVEAFDGLRSIERFEEIQDLVTDER